MRQVQVTPKPLGIGKETLAEYARAFDDDPTVQNLMNLTWTLVDTAARLWFAPRFVQVEMPDNAFFIRLADMSVAFAAKVSAPVPSKTAPLPFTQVGVTTILEKQYSTYMAYNAIFAEAPNYEMAINIAHTLLVVTALLWRHARRKECITPLDKQLSDIASSLISGLTEAVAKGASPIPQPPPPPN